MNKVFQDVQLSGIVIPGGTYILNKHPKKLLIDDVESLYVIRSDEEVVAALDMQVNMIDGDKFELVKFMGIKSIGWHTLLIRLLCYDKLYCVNVVVRFFLHRLNTLNEQLSSTKDIYDIE